MLARKLIVGMALLVCIGVVVPVRATTYYVDPNGSDDANGLSLETPFETIQKAADIVNPGDTVLVREGTYYENGRLDIERYGTENNYITFQPYNNELVIIAPSKTYDSWTSQGNGIYSRVFNDFVPSGGRLVKKEGYGITRVNTYEELSDPNISKDGIAVLNLNGMDANNIDLYYFDSDTNELSVKLASGTPNDVYVITFANRVEIGDVNTDAFIEISGFTIQYTYEGIKSYGNYCRFINNTIKHTSESGIFSAYGDDLLIKDNNISYTGAPLKYHPYDANLLIADNQVHSIYVKNTQRVTIRNNTTGRCIGGPSMCPSSDNCEIYNNYIEGGYYGGGTNNKIYNNIITIKYNTCVGFRLENASYHQVYNNTIIAPYPVLLSIYNELQNLTFKNNIAYAEGYYCMGTGLVDLLSADIDNNAYYGGGYFRVGVYPDWEQFNNFDDYQAYMINNYNLEANSFYANPDFVDPNNGDYHISIHSPCVNRGEPNNYTGQVDIDGEPRVIAGRVDMGADEVNVPVSDAHQWGLDETSGTIAYDLAGNSDGNFNGADPCWVDGLFGGAVDLNGVSDYFSVPTLDGGYNSSDTFSVAGWFKTSKSTGKQTIVGQWGTYMPISFVTLYFGWQALVENNKVVARFGPASSSTSDITGTSDVNDGDWHHFALVYPTKYANAVLYVDSNQEGTPGKKNWTPGYTKFRIGDGSYRYVIGGGTPVLKGGPFCGTIDDVMIFGCALTADEVEELYERGL